MFALNEKVVYPGLGVAQINRIIEKKIGGSSTIFFELFFINKHMTILVPVKNASEVGVRHLTKRSRLEAILSIFKEPVETVQQKALHVNWNKRQKEYKGVIRSGNIEEIAEIYRDIVYLADCKELSFGEKRLLKETEGLLLEEIQMVFSVDELSARDYLHRMIGHTQPID